MVYLDRTSQFDHSTAFPFLYSEPFLRSVSDESVRRALGTRMLPFKIVYKLCPGNWDVDCVQVKCSFDNSAD